MARDTRIRNLDVHTFNLRWGLRILPNGQAADRGSFQAISDGCPGIPSPAPQPLRDQSLELFRAVKMTRGDVNNAHYTSVRDLD